MKFMYDAEKPREKIFCKTIPSDAWSAYVPIAMVTQKVVFELRKQVPIVGSCPPKLSIKEWENVLGTIENAMLLILNDDKWEFNEAEEKAIDEGLLNLAAYFRDLWN